MKFLLLLSVFLILFVGINAEAAKAQVKTSANVKVTLPKRSILKITPPKRCLKRYVHRVALKKCGSGDSQKNCRIGKRLIKQRKIYKGNSNLLK
jgi:hypothetical protein